MTPHFREASHANVIKVIAILLVALAFAGMVPGRTRLRKGVCSSIIHIRQLSRFDRKRPIRPLFLLYGEKMSGLPERVEQQIEKIVSSEGLELVHIEYRKQGRGFLLRVDIDKEGGVNLQDCELISHQISTYLDVDDVVPAEYELQVSSPGLDRKFYKPSDYAKFIGRLVRVKTSQPIRGLHVVVGKLKEFDGAKIVVTDPKMKKDPDYEIPLDVIKETRLEVEI